MKAKFVYLLLGLVLSVTLHAKLPTAQTITTACMSSSTSTGTTGWLENNVTTSTHALVNAKQNKY